MNSSLADLVKKNSDYNNNNNKKKNFKRSFQSKQSAEGRWSHEAYLKEEGEEDDEMMMDDHSTPLQRGSGNEEQPWLAVISNLHWNV
jgi:hypothetical protein